MTAFAEELGLLEEEPSWKRHSWEELERVRRYLHPDERIVASLMREGKTPTQIASVLRLASKQLALKEMRRVEDIFRFYLRWGEVARKIPVEGFAGEKNELLVSLVLRRLPHAEVQQLVRARTRHHLKHKVLFFIDSLMRDGYADLARLLQETWSFKCLRAYMHGATGNRREWKGRRRAEMVDPWRYDVRSLLLSLVGRVDYEWGGQKVDWSKTSGKADCSGLVIEILQKVGRLPSNFRDTNALGLSRFFSERTSSPQMADLAFYGRAWSSVTHVMFFLGEVEALNARGAVCGMVGGDVGLKAEQARLLGANLYLRRSSRYRGDFLGFGVVS